MASTFRSRLDWQAIYSQKIRWRVSAKAVIRRAHTLGLLDAVQYSAANRYLGRSGQSKVELYDDRIPFESTELVTTAIGAYLKTYGATLGDLAGRLGMTPALLSQLAPGLTTIN